MIVDCVLEFFWGHLSLRVGNYSNIRLFGVSGHPLHPAHRRPVFLNVAHLQVHKVKGPPSSRCISLQPCKLICTKFKIVQACDRAFPWLSFSFDPCLKLNITWANSQDEVPTLSRSFCASSVQFRPASPEFWYQRCSRAVSKWPLTYRISR